MHCIYVQNLNVWEVFHYFAQYLNNSVVYFNSNDCCASLSKCKCKRAKTGTNFKNEVVWSYVCQARNFAYRVWINKKVLTKCAARCKTVLVQQVRNVVVRVRHQVIFTGIGASMRSANCVNCVEFNCTVTPAGTLTPKALVHLMERPLLMLVTVSCTPTGVIAEKHTGFDE